MSNWKYKTDGELRAAGYELKNVARCSGETCGASIEWWKTPQGNMIPLDEGSLQPHWSTCPDAKKFRGEKPVGELTQRIRQNQICGGSGEVTSVMVSGPAPWDAGTPFRCCMPACQEKTPQQRPGDVNVPMCSGHWRKVPEGLRKAVLAHADGNKTLLRAALAAAIKEASRAS